MKCPRCGSSQMQERHVISEDGKTNITNYLCSACCKRVIHTSENKRIPMEQLFPAKLVTNPYYGTRRKSQGGMAMVQWNPQ